VQGFLLGLATGTVCLAYCAPVLLPYILGEGRKTGQNFVTLGEFMGGRLCGYLLFGVLAWAASRLMLQWGNYRELAFGLIYIALAVMLLVYGLTNPSTPCAARSLKGRLAQTLGRWPFLMPLALGFLTGLNLCPPFLLAFTGAAWTGSLGQSVLYFLTFFLGTSIYFLPMPFLGLLERFKALRTIGRLAGAVVAIYYLYMGIILFGGGIHLL